MFKKLLEKFKTIDTKITFLWVISVLVIFGCLCFFFINAHPMYIFDTDDWMYISRTRLGIPIPGYWNPTRVLPEIMFPLSAEFGIDFIMPFTHDYIGSIAVGCALSLCVLATAYITFFAMFIKKEYKPLNAVGIMFLFFVAILQFLPFFSEYYNFSHMFYASNVTCVFFYVCSGMVNAILVFVLWTNEKINWRDKNKVFVNGLLILLMFLSVNSNLFQSIISASFAGVVLLERLIVNLTDKNKESRKKVWEWIVYNLDYIIYVCAWFVSVALEGTGGRAEYGSGNFTDNVKTEIKIFVLSMSKLNKYFLLASVACIVGAIILCLFSLVRKNKTQSEIKFIRYFLRSLFCFIINGVFLILLCSKVNTGYMYYSWVLWGAVFFVMLMMIVSMEYIFEKIPQLMILLPLAIFVLCTEVVITRTDYCDIYEPQTSKLIDDDIVNQVLEAQSKGETVVKVHIPECQSPLWPYDTIGSGSEKMSNSLYRHNIINQPMTIIFEPDGEMNKKYNYY